jgi:hypothetical protein
LKRKDKAGSSEIILARWRKFLSSPFTLSFRAKLLTLKQILCSARFYVYPLENARLEVEIERRGNSSSARFVFRAWLRLCPFLFQWPVARGEEMQQRKAIIIDVPIRKFMDEPPQNRVIGRSGDRVIEKQRQEAMERVGGDRVIGALGEQAIERTGENRVIGRSGDRVIEKQDQEALDKTAESGLSTREGAHSTALREDSRATETGAVCTWRRGNGTMCGRPADGGRDECWLHAEWYSLLPAVLGMPYPEDAVAIHHQVAPQLAAQFVIACAFYGEISSPITMDQREMGMW